MLFKEMPPVYDENQRKPINENKEISIVTAVGRPSIVTTGLQRTSTHRLFK